MNNDQTFSPEFLEQAKCIKEFLDKMTSQSFMNSKTQIPNNKPKSNYYEQNNNQQHVGQTFRN